MPSYLIQNRTAQRLFVPPPVNRILQAYFSETVSIPATEMETPAIKSMVSSGLLSITASDDARLTDELEVPVLSMIRGGGGAPSDAAYLTLASSSGLTNERVFGTSADLTTSDTGSNLTVGLASTGVAAGTYGAGDSVPVLSIDSKGRVTSVSTASNFPAHEGYATLAHDLSQSSYQEVTYTDGLPTAVTYWATSAKTLKLRETIFSYAGSGLVSSVTERQYDGSGIQTQQLVHAFSYNANDTLLSITTVRS